MIDVTIIGIGSPFGSDRLGEEVIDLLMKNIHSKKVNLSKCDRPGLKLVELIKNKDNVILIDAVKCNLPAGYIQKLNIEDLLSQPSSLSSHGFGVAEALKLTTSLGQLPKQLTIYGIAIDDVNQHSKLTSPVKKACFELSKKITAELQLLNNQSGEA